MKITIFALLVTIGFTTLFSCSSQKNTPKQPQKSVVTGKNVSGEDIIIYDNRVVADPVSFAKELSGEWKVVAMQWLQKSEWEQLSNVTLNFDVTNSKFSGQAPCNRINGGFVLSGAGIRFNNIASTRMSCDKLDQEAYYLKLLNENISAFSIKGDSLYLRDVAGNIALKCTRP